MTGRRIIYFDNAATSWPKPPEVVAAMTRFLTEQSGYPIAAGHRMSAAAARTIADARQKIARLIHAPDPARVILTCNCTDALNIAIKGCLKEGDHAITTVLEHNSVSRPLQAMADRKFIALTRLPVSANWRVDPDAVAKAITPRTRMIAVTFASNVIGTIQPVADIGHIARTHDVLFLVDAAQAAGVLEIDVEALHIDLLTSSGHKSLRGPTGTGFLFVGDRAHPHAFREGGSGGDSASPTQPQEYPTWLEAGTPNTLGFAGLAAALDVLDPPAALRHERLLLTRLAESLSGQSRVRIVGPGAPQDGVGVMSLLVEGVAPVDVGAILDEAFGICVRPGMHCAPYMHRALGTFPDGTIRVSPGPANTTDEIDRLAQALIEIAAQA